MLTPNPKAVPFTQLRNLTPLDPNTAPLMSFFINIAGCVNCSVDRHKQTVVTQPTHCHDANKSIVTILDISRMPSKHYAFISGEMNYTAATASVVQDTC